MADPPKKQRGTAKIKVMSRDQEDEDEDMEPTKSALVDDGDEDEKEKQARMSEEDALLKETLEKAVAKLVNPKSSSKVREAAVDTLSKEIRTSTSSMTSVPKPLKFLRPHYDDLKAFYAGTKAGSSFAKSVADVLSVMGMTMAEGNSRECLAFKLKGNREELGAWGHEFVRALSGEISQEFVARTTAEPPQDCKELVALVDIIIPFQMQHNSETEAVDLLLEVSELDKLLSYVDATNFERVCLYLVRYGEFCIALEDLETVMGVAYKLYFAEKQFPDALRVAMRINDMPLVEKAMDAAKRLGDGGVVQKQMALMLGAHKYFGYTSADDEVNRLVSNEDLWEHFQSLARELNVEEPKTPEEVYKSHLSESSSMMQEAAHVESARQNLASTFVNAFVNVGFQKDALMTPPDSKWLYKNKEHGMTSAAASLGMVLLWNVNEGMSQIDKYLYSSDYIKAGALLALGIVNCGVRDEVDPALGLLPEHLEDGKSDTVRLSAALGLGLAYAGNPKEEVAEVLVPVVADTSSSANIEVAAMAALALGLVFAGTANEDVVTTLVQRLMEASEAELDQPIAKMLCVGLGVLFLGAQDNADATIEAVRTVEHRIAKFAVVCIEACAYTGTGNVLQVQKLMHLCAEHLDKNGEQVTAAGEAEADGEGDAGADGEAKAADAGDAAGAGAAGGAGDAAGAAGAAGATEEGEQAEQSEEDKDKDKQTAARNAMHQSMAVIGVALITMGESVGRDMAQRSFQHLLQYGDLAVRRAVPLAMALSHVSDPDFAMIDILSKLTHDADQGTAMSAIFSLGLLGAGSNNSRVAQLLRSLASFYAKDPNPLFMVRLAQGLLHAGKGLVTLSPYHSDRTLMSGPAVAGLLAVVVCCLDPKSTLLGNHHYLMYTLCCAIRPRMLLTLDADTLEPAQVKVRVGQAVETVGQVGRPKTITGFQTHSTPVLMGHGDRAELVTEDYAALTTVLEGVVLLKKKKKSKKAAAEDADADA